MIIHKTKFDIGDEMFVLHHDSPGRYREEGLLVYKVKLAEIRISENWLTERRPHSIRFRVTDGPSHIDFVDPKDTYRTVSAANRAVKSRTNRALRSRMI